MSLVCILLAAHRQEYLGTSYSISKLFFPEIMFVFSSFPWEEQKVTSSCLWQQVATEDQ